jgi:anti-anti-sigma factor
MLTVRGMKTAALVFITCPAIHEHQAAIIQTRLLALAEKARGRLAISLAEVSDMTSAGINALVAVHNRCRQLGGGIALFGLSREVRRMLKVTRLDRTIQIAETPHEAVRVLSESEPARRGIWSIFTWARSDRDAA